MKSFNRDNDIQIKSDIILRRRSKRNRKIIHNSFLEYNNIYAFDY